MRLLTHAALVALALLCAPLVHAATLPATPATAAAVIKGAQPGDRVEIRGGELATIPLKYRPDSLTIDLTGVTVTGNSGTGVFNGLTIVGGRYTGAIPFTFTQGGKGLALRDMEMVAPAGVAAGSAVSLLRIDGATIANLKLTGYRNGVTAQETSNLDIGGVVLDRTQVDCFSVAAVWTVRIHGNVCKGSVPPPGAHADCAQIRSIATLKPTSDVIVEDNDCEGPVQGPTTTAKADDGGLDRITYRRNHVVSNQPTGLGVNRVRGAVLEDNDIATWPGSAYPSRIYVDADSTDVVWIGTNTQAAYGKLAAVSYPPTVKPPPPPPVDPKDAQIAALQADLAAARDKAASDAEAARIAADSLQQAWDRAKAEVDRLRGLLGQILVLSAQ